MNSANNDYGLWSLVLLNSVVFIGFAYSFFKPSKQRDWTSFGAYSAFIVALFAEMYGFPLTIFLSAGFGHEAGHLRWLFTFTGQHSHPHTGLSHLPSFVTISAGFLLLSKAWHVLYHAQRRHKVATAGPYHSIRHPQYVAFVLIMFGFLLQWPTLLTLAMFPVLVVTYVRLAISEEHESEREFGEAWRAYADVTPRFFPS
ncbi:methyltransferase family protein [Variovorax sp. RT4R15]|uniref:methyltransferase family protein n=1 Tax=Variovorax sp. RT4R15 TaxID=3443737 RepID=UPI003F4635F1